MAPKGKYLYGLVRANSCETLGDIGVQGKEVYAIPYKDVAAVVSDHPNVRVKPLRLNLKPHHEVIKEASNHFTIIPVSFGHISKSRDDILKVLKINYESISKELGRLDGKVEMGLKVFLDVDDIFDYFIKKYHDLEEFRDRIYGRSSPQTREEMIELGKLFEEKLYEEREEVTSKVIKVINISDYRRDEPHSEKQLTSLAFLIDKDKEEVFEKEVYRAASLFDGNFSFDYSGPWAPFNFVELELELKK